MKTIGIIGGMSFESTIEYYRIINEEINKTLGSLHSAKILIESYDFYEIEKLQASENWKDLSKILSNSAQKLEKMGADYVAIATNTMHLVANEVQNSINIPLIHIANATGNYILKKGYDKVCLFGTKYTMLKPFYKDILQDNFNIDVIIPDENEIDIINDIIYKELCVGIISEKSKDKLNEIILSAKNKGAKAIILGCTELPLIIKKSYIDVIDTTKIHSLEIAKKIMEN